MTNKPLILRRLLKSKSLRLINLIGLSLLFACMLTSYTYVSWEESFDQHQTNSDRSVRMTYRLENQTRADGRLYERNDLINIVNAMPEVEEVVKLMQVPTSIFKIDDKKEVIHNVCLASDNLFQVFNIPLLEGDQKTALSSPSNIMISERLALQLFGSTKVLGQKIEIESRKFDNKVCYVSAVYKDMPSNSHWQAEVILYEKDFANAFFYSYLLTKAGTDIKTLEKAIEGKYREDFKDNQTAYIDLLPMTDIHLHSHVARELGINGNMNYIYLLIGANILLLTIVFFNLWLNSSVVFSYNRRYYQLLRMNGAPASTVLKEELKINCLLIVAAIIIGKLLFICVAQYFNIANDSLSVGKEILFTSAFLFGSLLVSLLPALFNLYSTLFFDNRIMVRPISFSFARVKYMLVIQYCIVIFIIIVSVGINKQIDIIRQSQMASSTDNILVVKEQPEEVIERFAQLKAELEKHPEIESVTAGMQLPGDNIQDGIGIKIENGEDTHSPFLVVGEDFFSFYKIQLLAGRPFPSPAQSFKEEQSAFFNYIDKGIRTEGTEYAIINEEALKLLGYKSAEEAVGKAIKLDHMVVPSRRQVIGGVTENFTYTNIFEEVKPVVILQKSMFSSCFMIRFADSTNPNNINILNDSWNKINADYTLSYDYLQDTYNVVYRNELIAEKTINFFSVLCLIITILGLIVFMSFMIRMRTKEIGIRKVNGASNGEIINLLNISLLRWIILSIVVAIPLSIWVMNKWLENFAYKATLQWWIYAASSIFVVLISLLAISYQSWKAGQINPVDSIKSE